MEPLNEIEKQFVEQILAEDLKFRCVESNIHFILDAVERTDARGENLTESKVRRAISNVAETLAANDAYAGAFRTFFAAHPSLNLTANELILASLVQSAGGAITAENLEIVANDPAVKARLATTQAYKDDQAAEQAERDHWSNISRQGANMILDLTNYLLGEDGEVKGKGRYEKAVIQKRLDKETAELSALTYDQLSTRHAQWEYEQKLRGMSTEEVRAIVRGEDKARRASYTEFLPIPEKYSPPGKPEVFIKWSTELFKRLPAVEQRRLFKLFGEIQLNAALNAAVATAQGQK
jgi:hypothetical protein